MLSIDLQDDRAPNSKLTERLCVELVCGCVRRLREG